MLKKILPLTFVVLASGCMSTGDADRQAYELNYSDEPTDEYMLENSLPFIKRGMTDPDSLKNVELVDKFQCYISKMKMTDNVSPKYTSGHWCASYKFYGTNSYGAYVSARTHTIYINGKVSELPISETVRKTGDVWTSFVAGSF